MVALSAVIGEHPALRSICDQIARLLDRVSEMRRLPPVLLQGETGTGKGLLAHEIHRAGPRHDGPFVDVNCAAIPETLLEAEMFGFERGAFTDAHQAKAGLFEAASGGTLFLDELGYLPDALQAKLLKVIEERTVRRLGSTRSHPVDVSIIAATSQDLEVAVRSGRFRPELYHRLAVFTVRLPPLRERGADVLVLAEHFLSATSADYRLDAKAFDDDARRALAGYSWPGNVRELANVVERAALLSDTSLISPLELNLPRAGGGIADAAGAAGPAPPEASTEHARLLEALAQSDGNLSRAAARLGIARNTLRYRLERHGLRAAPPSRRKSPPGAPAAADASGPPASAAAPGHAPAAAPAIVRRETRRLAALGAIVAGTEIAVHSTGQALALVADKLQTFGGVIEELGDHHVFAVFGRDPAGDAPRRAALAAMAFRRAAAREPWSDRERPLTIAIHVQECTVGVVGDTVTLDAEGRRRLFETLRALAGIAPPGGVVASRAAAAALERRFEVVATGERLQGDRVYELTGSEHGGFGARGHMTPFVGRREELDWLRTRLGSALGGRGQVVGVSGEAGIGKSRLIAELSQDAATRATTFVEGRCVSYATTTPYLPILTIVRQLCGITDAESADAIAAKVAAALTALGMDAVTSAPYLVELLGVPGHVVGMSPEMVRTRTFETVCTLVLQAARRRPLVLVIEDLHWIDETSDALLSALVDGVARARLLLLLTYRPGYSPRWLDRSYAGQLALRPLSRDESLQVVRATLAAQPVPTAVIQTILTRGEGNPFFLEELSRAVADEGSEPASVAVPGTVQDVLAGRIAKLDAGDSRLLQAASVIGKDVGYDLLRAVAEEPEETLAARLRRLQGAEFLTVTSIGPRLAYTFKHALTHEVAYRSLPPESQRRLHGRIVDALEKLHADRLDEHVEELAHHALGAERWHEAVRFLRRCAATALVRSANLEAVALTDQALAALAHLPDGGERSQRELTLHTTRGVALIALYGYASPVVESTYARARELCGQVGQTPRLLWALIGLGAFHLFRGELNLALELSEQCLVVVAPYPESPLRGWAHLAVGTSQFWLGRLPQARRELERSLALYDVVEQGSLAILYGQDSGVWCLAWLAALYCALGAADLGAETAQRGVALAESLAHSYSAALALTMAAAVHQLRREPPQARQRAEAALALATEKGLPMWRSMATFFRGWALSEEGLDEGIEEMRRGIAAWRSLGSELACPWFLTLLAGALGARGRIDEGLAAVGESLELTARAHSWYEPEAHRVHGELLLAGGRAAEAEEAVRRALEVAREQEATLFELRAALTLSRMLEASGGREEARRLLGDVHARFTQGFDTPDLADARTRLAELGP